MHYDLRWVYQGLPIVPAAGSEGSFDSGCVIQLAQIVTLQDMHWVQQLLCFVSAGLRLGKLADLLLWSSGSTRSNGWSRSVNWTCQVGAYLPLVGTDGLHSLGIGWTV